MDHDLKAERPFVRQHIPGKVPVPARRKGWKGLFKNLHVAWTLGREHRQNEGEELVLMAGWGGAGDDLLYSALAREWHKRTKEKVFVISRHRALFANNPAVAGVLPPDGNSVYQAERCGWRVAHPAYLKVYASSRPAHLTHTIAMMADDLGIEGEVSLRPVVYLKNTERHKGRIGASQIAIQSSVLSARFPSYNKQWPVERMAQVAEALARRHTIVQVGGVSDPLLPGVIDKRGEKDLRTVAAILAESQLFVGLEGFLSHLARAVDSRSVIVYGGYTRPEETGYPCNENLYKGLPCSPCWEPSGCDFARKCLDVISPAHVLAAVDRALAKKGQPLETQKVHLPDKE